MESKGSDKLLAPGFRFHPTDEELVRYYLRRKIIGKPLRFDAISEIDIYKVEPWDLPGMSRLKTRDLEWYFFSVLDRKHGNGAKTNRATERGYWKTTGKDRAVNHKSKVVGMKKTLVFHSGRAPKGQRTNWVMHEYKLIDEELDKAGISQDALVLCRVFQKSGAGPKNGEKYGAPFVEEEWEEDDELEIVPKKEVAEEFEFGDDIYLDGHDLEQILGTDTPVDSAPLSSKRYCEENASNNGETSNSFEEAENWLQPPDEQESFDPAIEHYAIANPVKHEFMNEPSNSVNSEDADYLLDEPIVTATDNLQFNDGAFLEASDLSRPIEVDTSSFDMLEEYLTFFDADDDFQSMDFNPPMMIGGDAHVSDLASLEEKNIGELADQPIASSEEPEDQKNNVASCSKLEPSKFGSGSDYKYPFMKQASCMLGGIPAPPACASEFPSKALRMNSSSEASSSIHVTGLVQITNMTMSGNGTDGLVGKHGNYNVILSFGISQLDDSSAHLGSVVSVLPGKTMSTLSWFWFYYLFLWVLILSTSFKIGTLIRVK
ncbi:NAC domain-containing protein 78-like isoform X1 [Lycium barbarum]|uniref:NAC domain-containing protein 78-like isoform X1 n=1 Tax=Lycium barbarum TaxID=112863 RepID=UPI00293E5A42|nr:NAC domain-containing protein 78-like isoform X1 [Lycium barbarum]